MIDNIRYELMRPGELEAALRRAPIAWLPFGMLEWHGRHLPAGLDAIKAHAICELAARRAGGVVLPPNFIAAGGMKFPWTFHYPPGAAFSVAISTMRGLREKGFRAAIAITGHYPISHVLMLMAAAETVMSTGGPAIAAAPEFAAAMQSGYLGDHAAMWETSIMMHLFPHLVDETEMSRFTGRRPLDLMSREGVSGANPATRASRELGETITAEIVDGFSALAARLLSSDAKSAARSFHRDTVSAFTKGNISRLASALRV